MGERQTPALRPEPDQGAPHGPRGSPLPGLLQAAPCPISRVPLSEVPLGLRASSEWGAGRRVRRRKDESISFSGSPPPRFWGPVWLLQASTQKQLSSLRTRCSRKAPHRLVKKREAESMASPPLPPTTSGCLCSAQLEAAGERLVWSMQSHGGPRAQGQAPTRPAGRGGAGGQWSAAGSALFSSLTLEWSLHLHCLCNCQPLSLVLPFAEALLQEAVLLKLYSVEYGLVLAYWFMQDAVGPPCTSH